MRTRGSIVVTLDGESKCGKTRVAEAIAREAEFQRGVIPDILEQGDKYHLKSKGRGQLQRLQDISRFNRIGTISAGNVFRAATLQVARLKRQGVNKTEFDDNDTAAIRAILNEDGIESTLQNDEIIRAKVSSVAKMAGAQAMCGRVFCDWMWLDYSAGIGSNLVIIDARNPVGHMIRNGRVGTGKDQVPPRAILPIYIETPVDVAASRMDGDFDTRLAEIQARRLDDVTREELPVTKPSVVHRSFSEWTRHVYEGGARSEVAAPYHLENGRAVTLDNIQYFAGVVAMTAQNFSISLKYGQSGE